MSPAVRAGAELRAIAACLHRVVASCDVAARLERDPVGLVREVSGEQNRELAGLLAASLAFGNVTALRASIRRVLERLGPGLAEALDDPAEAHAALKSTGHRMVRGEDIGRLLVGARAMQREHGMLGARFATLVREHGALRPSLVQWTRELRGHAGLRPDPARRGPSHILPDPGKSSGCKRLMLLLRWMVRHDDGVDLGLWPGVSPSLLLIPVDTHIHRLALNLGLTSCAGPTWQCAEQITASLRRIDPDDPVRFDFALCHLGMLQGCPSRRDPSACSGCGIRAVCKHWARR